MMKKGKSLLALSLGITVSSQNMIISSANEATILSDDEFKVKVNTIDKDDYSSKSNKFDKYQVDPEVDKDYSMGGHSNKIRTLNETSTKKLSNPYAIGSGNVTSNNLNVRSGPSTSNSSIGKLQANTTVEIVGVSNDWYKISYQGGYGYVSSSYIKLNILEKGIDVSKWNGSINWQSVKNSGVDYVIIRGGYGTSTVDSQFKNYIEGARNAGLKIGVYWFSYATSPEMAKAEAKKCLNTIAPYKNSINYPVFFDYEYDSVAYARKNGINVTKNLATQIANAFLNTVKASGYSTGIYTNKNFSSNYFTENLINSNNLWIAQYNSVNTFGRPHSIWQYSEKGMVPGIKGNVDLNYTFLKTWKTAQTSESISSPSTSFEKGKTTHNLNLRKSASTSSGIIMTIPKNSSIDIVDKSTYGWYKIRYNNNIGYVSSNYVTLNTNISNTPSSTHKKYGVTTANLNFRKSASTSSLIIKTIPKNTSVEILEKLSSGWYKVKYKGLTGYVVGTYIK